MKHKGIAKKAGTFLITAILAAAFAVQTAAAVPAESEKAALTIQASSDGTGIAGVEWSVYQVAEMPQDGVFILTGDFAADVYKRQASGRRFYGSSCQYGRFPGRQSMGKHSDSVRRGSSCHI